MLAKDSGAVRGEVALSPTERSCQTVLERL
jgi:hypothetical protein